MTTAYHAEWVAGETRRQLVRELVEAGPFQMGLTQQSSTRRCAKPGDVYILPTWAARSRSLAYRCSRLHAIRSACAHGARAGASAIASSMNTSLGTSVALRARR